MHIARVVLKVVFALIVASALVVAVVSRNSVVSLERRIQHIEKELAKMDERAFVMDGGRVIIQMHGEDRESWAARVARMMSGDENVNEDGFQCTTLTGCNTPSGSVVVCTPPGGDHQADIDAICAALRCTNCPPASPR